MFKCVRVQRFVAEVSNPHVFQQFLSEIKCIDPPAISHGSKLDLSGQGNYSFGAQIQYQCSNGFYVAEKQDPTGAWITDADAASSTMVKATCMSIGKWYPSVHNIQCIGECYI